jgi:hypothetical protein
MSIITYSEHAAYQILAIFFVECGVYDLMHGDTKRREANQNDINSILSCVTWDSTHCPSSLHRLHSYRNRKLHLYQAKSLLQLVLFLYEICTRIDDVFLDTSTYVSIFIY